MMNILKFLFGFGFRLKGRNDINKFYKIVIRCLRQGYDAQAGFAYPPKLQRRWELGSKPIFFLFFCLFVSQELQSFNPIRSLFDSVLNYQAHKQYQKGDFAKAQHEYQELLTDNPANAEYEYNVGVSLYKQKQYDQAREKFNHAIDHAVANGALQEQALFNRGNCAFEQDKFQDAINDYKKVLKINSENKNAAHNLKLAEQKLKEQKRKEQEQKKKEEEQKKQDQQKQDQNKDCKNCNNPKNSSNSENKQNQQQDQNQKDQDQQQEQNKQQSKDNQQQKNKDSKSQKSDQSREKNKPDQSEQDSDQSGDKDQQQGSDKQDRQQNAKQSDQQQGKQKPEEKLEKAKKEPSAQGAQEQKDKKENMKHDQSLSDKEQLQAKASQGKDQKDLVKAKELQPLTNEFAAKMMPKIKDDERLDKQHAQLLEKLDDYEKNIQKKLLQLNVSKQGASKYGQKNW